MSMIKGNVIQQTHSHLRHEYFEEGVGHGPLLLDVAPDPGQLLLLLLLLPRVVVDGAAVDERRRRDRDGRPRVRPSHAGERVRRVLVRVPLELRVRLRREGERVADWAGHVAEGALPWARVVLV